MLRITIPKRIKDSYNKNGDIITIDIYSDDDENLLTTTCRGWNKKWHHCPHSIAHKKIRIVNNNCRTCYTEGSPLCRTCSTSSNIQLNVLKINVNEINLQASPHGTCRLNRERVKQEELTVERTALAGGTSSPSSTGLSPKGHPVSLSCNDRYSNKLNDILCHYLIRCPEFLKK